jgi:two-component system, OmpR family, phosphate regulon response regulator OmpR
VAGPVPPARVFVFHRTGVDNEDRMRVLIVDDELEMRQLLQIVCEDEGHETRAVATVPAALDLWRRWTPSCILLDLLIPGHPGTEVVRRVRMAGDPTPIIVISGELRPDWLALVKRFGITAVVPKPFHTDEVINLLRAVRAGDSTGPS